MARVRVDLGKVKIAGLGLVRRWRQRRSNRSELDTAKERKAGKHRQGMAGLR